MASVSNSSLTGEESDSHFSPPTKRANGARTNGQTNGRGHGDDSSDDEEVPLSQATSEVSPIAPARKRKKLQAVDSSSDDDTPLASSSPVKPKVNGTPTSKGKTKPPPKKKAKIKKESDSESADSDSDKPKRKSTSRKRKVKVESDEDMNEDDDRDTPKKAPAKKAKVDKGEAKPKKEKKEKGAKKEEPTSPVKGKKRAKQEEEEEDVYRWWDSERPVEDDSVKWTTLEHSGVLFPPPYEPLPKDVKMKYNGKPVDLPPQSEEVAGFYGAMLETDHAKDDTFNKNFFDDWKLILKKYPPRDGTKITDFALCDFRGMYEHFEAERAKKKALSNAEKKELKKQKDEMELKYTTCLLDGRKEKVGNFRVEPPGLFRGRGEHPKKGSLKFRVRPEDITLNIGADAPVPVPNMPGKWKAIQHDNTVTWLATWTENVNGNHKYVFLAAGSSLKGQSDMQKFEKARELKNHVDRIRQNYNGDLKTKVMADRQRATAMYFIDKLALRAGNEKGEEEADTVGCCSLRCEHLTLEAPNFIIFDFLGKDSIRYYKKVDVDPQVFKNIKIFKQGKDDEDDLFDRVNTAGLNKHLNSEMKGLTAKVFRTFNASSTFQRLLDETDVKNATLQEKLNAYNKANRLVAILCNHQRTVPKTHDASMEKMREKYKGLKYDRMKLRHALFTVDSTYKKKKEYAEDESDLDEDWIATWEDQLEAKEIEKAEKKFAKENEKLRADNKEEQEEKVLKDAIANIRDDFKKLKKERGTGKATLKREKPAEKLVEAIEKLDQRIKTFKLQMQDRDEGKEVALTTSKINYLDPRITVSWCKANDVPIEKMFSKTLITKFPWAMGVDPSWQF